MMTLSSAEHQQMLNFRNALCAALRMAATERSKHEAPVETPYGTELEWMGRERGMLRQMVNQRRAQLRTGPVTEDEVYAVEQSAAGHIDYAEKFTLRLAFLAYGLDWRP